ncbi:unnamed protein product [Protopolystoma xenopodis]|uniref:Uncharacterized protein n=1 Tax=Protopolystoma xenopodis TaxID=117903 RepID=A0A3S5CM95_9PLAT|nr:unnamed protein product [Protopolystoma xenopodis]
MAKFWRQVPTDEPVDWLRWLHTVGGCRPPASKSAGLVQSNVNVIVDMDLTTEHHNEALNTIEAAFNGNSNNERSDLTTSNLTEVKSGLNHNADEGPRLDLPPPDDSLPMTGLAQLRTSGFVVYPAASACHIHLGHEALVTNLHRSGQADGETIAQGMISCEGLRLEL